MKKPYIVCHMMTSIDGRIDCAMTGQLVGVDDYYKTLQALETPTTLSGRVTAMLEMAEPGEFDSEIRTPLCQEGYSKKTDAKGYEVVVDTRGSLLWKANDEYEKPMLIITSEAVTKEYLSYLDSLGISWIACGKERIDLSRAAEILADEFRVERMSVVGGPTINTAFLEAGLLDEISILIGLGIDGRKEMPSVFDGFDMDHPVIPLKLKACKAFEDGAVWIRYSI